MWPQNKIIHLRLHTWIGVDKAGILCTTCALVKIQVNHTKMRKIKEDCLHCRVETYVSKKVGQEGAENTLARR